MENQNLNTFIKFLIFSLSNHIVKKMEKIDIKVSLRVSKFPSRLIINLNEE